MGIRMVFGNVQRLFTGDATSIAAFSKVFSERNVKVNALMKTTNCGFSINNNHS